MPTILHTADRVPYDQLGSNSDIRVMVHEREVPTQEGSFLLDLVARWGMVSCREHEPGERAFVLLPPEEVVARARQIVKLTMTAMKEEGWTQELPSIDEMRAEYETDREARATKFEQARAALRNQSPRLKAPAPEPKIESAGARAQD